jgi:hypothetical protein
VGGGLGRVEPLAPGGEQFPGLVGGGGVAESWGQDTVAGLRLEDVRGGGGDETSLAEDADAVAELVGLFQVLGGQQDGHAVGDGQCADLVPQAAAADRVESGGGFVQKEDVRTLDQGDGEVDTVALASTELADRDVGELLRVERDQELGAACAGLTGGE